MNTFMVNRSIKNIVIAVFSAMLFGTTFNAWADVGGQPAAPKPPKQSVNLLPSYGTGYWWPGGENTISTVELYSSQYLPYLYSMGLNMALMVDYADFFYQIEAKNVGANKPYKHDITALANIRYTQLKPDVLQKSADSTKKDVEQSLLPQNFVTISNQLITDTPGSDTVIPCVGITCNPNDKPTNKEFNADTLLSHSSYAASEQPAVDKLITFLSGMVDPTAGPQLSTDPDKRKEQLQNSDIQRFILLTRAMVASQSVALSNLNYLAKEREVIPDLGQQAAMTSLPTDGSENDVKDASQLQLEEFLVNRRVGNSAWYAAVNTAQPIAVQRETLFVLAEIEQQLLQLRMVNERLLAAMSVMQFQIAQLNKSQLSVIQQNIAESTADEGTAVPTETSTPSS
jgi:hypothetical protein